jgi:mersacidin/lichenicidin family type 2 lantibiotic
MAIDIKRALIDPDYRKTLTQEELAQLPKNPAGEVTENDLDKISGGKSGVKQCASIATNISSQAKPASGGAAVQLV